MSLFENWLPRIVRQAARRAAKPRYRPILEALEDRRCPVGNLVAPTVLGLAADGPTQATLTWTDVEEEAGYHILQWNGSEAVTVGTAPADATSWTVTGLSAGQLVWIGVEAFDDTTTAQSLWRSVELPVEPLIAPSGLTGTGVSPTQINLTWTDAQGETGYRLHRWVNGQSEVVATLAADVQSYSVTGLAPGTTTYFSLEAFNGSSAVQTDWASATTLLEPITAPTQLTLAASTNRVQVTWSGATGATGYRVYRWDGRQAVLVGQVNATITTLTATGLLSGTSYWFYVQAFNRSNAAATAWKVVRTAAPPFLPPAQVTVQRVSAGRVKLSWSGSARAAGYRVYRWTGTTWVAAATVPATARTFTVGGLAPGRRQWFAVMAFTSGFAESATSRIVTVVA